MMGSGAQWLILLVTSSLSPLSLSSDLVLVNNKGQPSDILRKAVSMMEDRDSQATRESLIHGNIKRRTMTAATRRIKRKPATLRRVSSESLYNKPATPRQRIKFSQRKVFSAPRKISSPRPFSLLRNMHVKRRRRKFQPEPQIEHRFVEIKVSKNCEDEIKSSEEISNNANVVQVEGMSKVSLKPTYQAENMTVAETSPIDFLELDTANNISERGDKTEDRDREMFEEHELKNQIQDKVTLMVDDQTVEIDDEKYSVIDTSREDENLITDDSTASDEYFSEDVTTFEPFITPVGKDNLTSITFT